MSSPPQPSQDSFSLYAKPTSKSLFSESPLLSFGAKTGPGGDDLSLSELSVNETTPRKQPPNQEPPRFSLFGVADSPQKGGGADDSYQVDEEEEEQREEGDEQSFVEGDSRVSRRSGVEDESVVYEGDSQLEPTTPKASRVEEDVERTAPKPTRRTREEELQATLYQMRSLNSVLLEYLEALNATERNNRILAQQVENSHQLLNKYTAILGQTEHTTRLLLDPQWQGAEADEELAVEQARQEALEQERREREEQERLERQEREAAERAAQEEREREARERAAKAPERGRPGVGRGLRGRGTTTRGAVPFPPGFAATIHLQWPGRPFQLLGMISNEKPSAIFRVRGTASDTQSGGASMLPEVDVTATLGISIEPIDVVQAQVEAMKGGTAAQPVKSLADPVVLAERIVKHLFNHLSSFEMQVGPQTVVPLGVIQRWYEGLVHKLKAGGAGFLMND